MAVCVSVFNMSSCTVFFLVQESHSLPDCTVIFSINHESIMDCPLAEALGPDLHRLPPRGAQAGSDVGWSRVPGAPVGGGRRSQQMGGPGRDPQGPPQKRARTLGRASPLGYAVENWTQKKGEVGLEGPTY